MGTVVFACNASASRAAAGMLSPARFASPTRRPETGVISVVSVPVSTTWSCAPGSGVREYLFSHVRTCVLPAPRIEYLRSKDLRSALIGGMPLHRMDDLSGVPLADPSAFRYGSTPLRLAHPRSVARRQSLNDFSTCGQACITSAAKDATCDATNSALQCICQDFTARDNALSCLLVRSCSEGDINVFDVWVTSCIAAQQTHTHTHHATTTSPDGVPATPTSSSAQTPVQSSTSPSDSSSTSTFPVTPSRTSDSSESSTPISPSLQPSPTTSLSSSSSSVAQASLTTTPRTTSTPSSIPTVVSASTNASPLSDSKAGSHRTPRKVVIALATSLGLVVLAAGMTVLLLYLRRLHRRRQLRRSVHRAHPSDLCVTGGSKETDVFQGSTSNTRNARVSIVAQPSAPSSSVIDISGPRTSVFVAPPSSPIARQTTLQQLTPFSTPRVSGEDRDGEKLPSAAVRRPDAPVGTVLGPPVPPPAEFVSVSTPRSGTSRGSRRFVAVLMEVQGEDEHDLPPPYQPGQRFMYDTMPHGDA